MSDRERRNVAGNILSEAQRVVTTERGGQHGEMEASFTMIANLWATYLVNTRANRSHGAHIHIDAFDVAQMMSLSKIARSVHGDIKNADNYIDASGYQSIAAAFAGAGENKPAIPVTKSKVIDRNEHVLSQMVDDLSGITGAIDS